MKIRINIKDPDGVYDGIQEAVSADVARVDGLSDDERESIEETRREEVGEKLKKWIEYGEYLVVDFDLEAMTATVKPRS